MAGFMPLIAAKGAEILGNHQQAQRNQDEMLATQAPEALTAVLIEREKTARRRMQLGCGGVLLFGTVAVGAVGFAVHQALELRDGVTDGIANAIDKVKPDTKVEISAAAAIEKIWFPEDMSLVDGDARAITSADVQEEVWGFGIPGTGVSFGYKSSATVGLELASPDALQKKVVDNPDGTQSLGLIVDGSQIEATLELFTGEFIPGTYDEGQLTEWLGSEGDTIDRGQVIIDHAQTTLIDCKRELLPFVTEGLQRRTVEQIDAAMATANAVVNATSTPPEQAAQAKAYIETLAALKEQPITVAYIDRQIDAGGAMRTREIPETALPLPNKLTVDGIDPYYVTNGQLAVSLGGEENEVQAATCTLADGIASQSPVAGDIASDSPRPVTTIIPNESSLR